MAMPLASAPMRTPGFSNLAFAYVVNELGNWLGEIALAVLVFDATGSAIATAGLFGAMQVLPALLGPLLVARLEATTVRVVLPLLYLGEAVAFILLAAMAHHFALAPVLAVAGFDGLLAASARALTRASVSSLLTPRGLLREGNSILNLSFTTAAAAGPALAGVIVAGAGPASALLVDAGSFAGAAALVALASGLPSPAPAAARWRDRLRGGIAYVRTRPAIRLLLGAQAAALVFFAAVVPIEVVFAKRTLGAGDAGYGALLASWGAGTIAGAALFARMRRTSLRSLAGWSTLVIGVAYVLTGAAPTLVLACAASVIGGAGNGVQYVAAVTALQEMTAPAYQAQIASLIDLVSRAAPGLGFILGGAVAALLSPRATFAIAGAGVLLVLALVAPALRRVSWAPAATLGDAAGEEAAVANGREPRALRGPASAEPIWRVLTH